MLPSSTLKTFPPSAVKIIKNFHSGSANNEDVPWTVALSESGLCYNLNGMVVKVVIDKPSKTRVVSSSVDHGISADNAENYLLRYVSRLNFVFYVDQFWELPLYLLLLFILGTIVMSHSCDQTSFVEFKRDFNYEKIPKKIRQRFFSVISDLA